jgi:enoyl-CoA hydratase/carnithine racemase
VDMPVAEAYAYMAQVMADNLLLADAHEGIGAFIQKRKPTWEQNQ